MEGKDRWQQAGAGKRQAYYALEDIHGGGRAARVAGIALFVLIVVNALLVFVELQADVPESAALALTVFGVASNLCFGAEYLLRLWIADLVRPSLAPVRARLRYAVSPMGIIDLLAFLPGILVLFLPLSSATVGAARIIRLFRLFKLSRYMLGLRSIERVLEKRRSEIAAAFAVLALLTVTASVLMFQVENPVQPEAFDSVFTGMYWAMTTITSTGYGDLVPVTPAGRLIGFATMVLSIAVVAIPAGIFSAGFVAEFRSQDADERRRHLRSHDAGGGDAGPRGAERAYGKDGGFDGGASGRTDAGACPEAQGDAQHGA